MSETQTIDRADVIEQPFPAAPRVSRARVLLACSGLEHTPRGFESFARECFDVLKDEPLLDLELVKGSGPSGDRERAVASLKRDGRVARALGRISGRNGLHVEQLAFAFSLQPTILRRKPHVVYFSEWYTGVALARLRRLTRQRFKLVLCNGTMAAERFEHLDHVQQLTAVALETVIARGADPSKQTLLPLGFAIERQFAPVTGPERRALRERLGLPTDRPVIVSTAALNRQHKRIDYLIEEVAQLPEPRPYLLLAGEPDSETPGISALARGRLGNDGHSIRTVPQDEVGDLYRASDLFVLASLGEAQGRSFVEALAHGLPALAHDYPIAHFALGELGRYADFSKPGALAELLRATLPVESLPDDARARHRFAYETFSWDRLRPRYVELLTNVAAGRSGVRRGSR
jgi:1,2-diacylglycerol 3-alpha-glucosyltransferase